LPARFFLQATSSQGAEMMMDIEDLHGVSLKNDRDFMMKLDSLKALRN
jgi:hypothetical protein